MVSENSHHRLEYLLEMIRMPLQPSLRFCLCSLVMVLGFLSPLYAANTIVVPFLDVQVQSEENTEGIPTWKTLWDEARVTARLNELEKARLLYLELFKLKSNIIEARWEYCKLLVSLNMWGDVSHELDSLIELEPDNLEFLILAGKVALKNKHFKKAVKYFGQVYESDPYGNDANVVLEGLVQGFVELGNDKSAYILLERLYAGHQDDHELLRKIATLSLKLGYIEKARLYYTAMVEKFPDDKDAIHNAATVFDYPGMRDKAAFYWEKYLTIQGDYIPFQQKLVDYYCSIDREDLALPHLIRIYNQQDLSPILALRIGKIYLYNLDRPDKALFYYEQYGREFPDNVEIIETIESVRNRLAHNYLSIVENNGELRLWNDLEYITNNREMLFLKMADLLKKEGKIVQEAALVKLVYENNNNDVHIAFRLSKLYAELNEYDDALLLLKDLDSTSYHDKKYLILKAEIEGKTGNQKAALRSLVQYLKNNQDDSETITRALDLAGQLGLINEVFTIWKNVPSSLKKDIQYLEVTLAYIEALRINGFFSHLDGLYDHLVENAKDDQATIAVIQLHRADSLNEQELVFEAEQVVRQVLAKNIAVKQALEKLVSLSITAKHFDWAKSWLSLLAAQYSINDLEKAVSIPASLHFLYVDLLVAENEYDDAEKRLLYHLENRNPSNEYDSKKFEEKSKLYLAKIYLLTDEYDRCINILQTLKSAPSRNEEIYVIRDILSGLSEISKEEREKIKNREDQKESFDTLYARAMLYYKYAFFEKALASLKAAKKIIPQSMVAKILEVKIHSALFHYREALEKINDIVTLYPDQDFFVKLQLQLEFKSGNFKKIVKKLPKEIGASLAQATMKNGDGTRDLLLWKRLLLARSLWAENRRDEALKVYDSLIGMPVDSMFLEKMEVEEVNFRLPPLKKSFWNMITFTSPAESNHITTIMDPVFVGQNIGQPIDDIAAGLYGKYRWQRLIEKELAARQAVEEKDYYRAEKEYRSLLKVEKSQETLFDLAGIYNRFGLYGKEAELYELMKKEGPLYPGLDEYIQANVLKRQPRISTTFRTSTRQGRENYIDIKKQTAGIEGWLSPSYDQELNLGVFQNSYSSHGSSDKIYSNRFLATYSTYFDEKFDLNLSVGSEKPRDKGTSEIVYKFEIVSRLNDFLEGYSRLEQDLVEDTIRSVTDSVIYRDFEAGLKYDVFSKWFIGADYRHRMYSDDNKQRRFKVWSMYHLFGEMNQFRIKYSYENIRNNADNKGRLDLSPRGFSGDDRVYWSPKHYWQHLFTLHFKHLFAGEKQPMTPLNYFSVNYTYGYEADYKQSHEFDMNIFLEINRHFLLQGNLNILNSEEYKETEAVLSLIYRW